MFYHILIICFIILSALFVYNCFISLDNELKYDEIR